MNYYNEFDPQAAAWLRQLIADGHLPAGDVDERSIEDVEPRQLARYTQCHFFAGIGGWPLALQLAGWPADRPIWTGSCPCQPFSAAGKGNGFADERHLWPSFHWLIRQSLPAVVVGEQVASAAVGPWIDLVLSDLEALGYACGAYAGPAAGVGAPHLRDRSYWVAYGQSGGRREEHAQPGRFAGRDCAERLGAGSLRSGSVDGLADASSERLHGFDPLLQWEGTRRLSGVGLEADWRGPTAGFWGGADWLRCRDDRWRPVEPGTFPLAYGVSARVGRLRGYGNAIVPQQAAEFIKALMAYPGLSL